MSSDAEAYPVAKVSHASDAHIEAAREYFLFRLYLGRGGFLSEWAHLHRGHFIHGKNDFEKIFQYVFGGHKETGS